MREFELIIDEALRRGLSPERMVPTNSQFLSDALGFRVGKFGLEGYLNGENPLPSTLDLYYSWPFPQFITGEGYNFLIVRDSTVNLEDRVYLVSDDMNTVTHIFDIDVLTFGTGTLMEVADFGEYAFMTNGAIMIYWNTTINDWHEVIADANIPMMRTICNFKGQAIGGNVVSSWHDCDEKFYIWSKIGSMDFTPGDDNEAGYRRCPYGGEVLHVKELNKFVVGYSSKGVTAIIPVTDPVPTFGFEKLHDVGILNQGAVDGNGFRHVYVGTDLIVREVTQEGVKELGFKHLMDEIDDEDIIVNYDRKYGDFYIGNSKKTYLLSPYGMSEIPQHPSAVWRIDEDEVYMLPEAVDDFYYTLTTEPFDFGYRGQKTVHQVETDAFLGSNGHAKVDYAFNLNTWDYGSYVPLNDEGIASIITGGVFFQFGLRFDEYYSGSRISYLKARYKMTDLRGLRGVYAPPPRGQ